MSEPLLIPFPGNEALAEALAARLPARIAPVRLHRFPDGESLVTLPPVAGQTVILVCTLHQPDTLLAPLLFAADAARDLGARHVGLVAPYLAYMRQDRRFHPGEAITSRTFAAVLSAHLDCLVTVDPHLHRYKTLDAIYTLPARAASAADAIATWIAREVATPVLVGPDSESAQWVEAIAAKAGGLPFTVLGKIRHDDTHVEVSLPDADRWTGHTPVLIDDIVSSARTMIAAVASLRRIGLQAPVCVGVHGLFAGDAYSALQAAGARRIVTCNSVPHPTNAIDVTPDIARALRTLLPDPAAP